MNPKLHLIMAFLGKISAHCDKPHFLPPRPNTTPDSRSIQKSLDWVGSSACTPQAPQHESRHVVWLMMMLHWQAGPLKPARSALEDARAKRAQSSSITYGSFSFVHVPGIPGALERPLIDRLHHSHNTTFSKSEGKRTAQSADQHV